MDDDRLFELVERTYDCAVDGQWSTLLEQISPTFGNSKVLLSSARQNGQGLHMLCGTHGIDDLAFQYLEQIECDPCYQKARALPDTSICMDMSLRQKLELSPVKKWYTEMEADFAISQVFHASFSRAVFTMNRPARYRQYTVQEQQAFGVLSDHMKMAMKSALSIADLVHERLSQWQSNHIDNDSALAIVRRDRSPVYMSAAMERMVESCGPFCWSRGRLQLQDGWHDCRLLKAHEQAINGAVCSRLGTSIAVGSQRLQVVPLSRAVYENASLWLIS
ncbi:hypothetical protein SAMN04488540_103318 [Ferrimonas sediminum]|uniref:Uncharacterized protein n=1 Tax=Ferrimonas sediminum TaxID=718193 RepID=A0A1G8P321_9GAMM|nr:hypothetical protein [Ferrimonas sediminum]SDI86889.1 hypothetical protein SAMN04488540_103318 [Ferrimonas sediminum]